MNLLRELDRDDRAMTGAVMTTFPFAPRFFERSVLPALRDKSVGETIAVLADSSHYEATLRGDEAEGLSRVYGQQPKYAGQRYHLAPISVGSRRAFHPKIHYITGERRVLATISSGNLTHPGLTNNREIATWVTVDADGGSSEEELTDEEMLTRKESAGVCLELAEFLDRLVDSKFGRSIDPVTSDTIGRTLAAAEWLEDINSPALEQRSTRFLHNLNDPLLTQVIKTVEDRGEVIEQVEIAAPFYGTSLGVPRALTDDGIDTRLWLQQSRTQVQIEELEEWLNAPNAIAKQFEDGRYAHGKIVVLRTDDGSYCLSGSPNASRAALQMAAVEGGGNIEAALLRHSPDPEYFDYLFGAEPFANADSVDLGSFEPGAGLEGLEISSEEETTDGERASEIELFGVSYKRRETYDGGTLSIHGRASRPIREAIVENGAELVVRAPNTEGESATFELRDREFEWDSEAKMAKFMASTDLYGEAAERPLVNTGSARLRCGENLTEPRWVQTHRPTTGEPTAEDVADAGARTVPRALIELYGGDTERSAELIDSLNGLLSALRSVDSGPGEAEEDDTEQEPGPKGGLRVRPWTQSGGRDPEGLIESFYEGWEEDLREFIRTTSGEELHFEEVEIRLQAINATTLQLLLLDEARPEINVPRQAALNTIKEVYSRQEPGSDRVDSLVGNYCVNLRFSANQADGMAEEIYNGLQSRILPHVVLAAVIAEAHVAGDRATFFNQQDWAFEALVGDCFPQGSPGPEHLSYDLIGEIVVNILDSIEGIRDRIEESRRLRRHANERYLDDDRLKAVVIELLGRSILWEGQEAVERYRRSPRFEEEIEQTFSRFVEYLPRDQKRSIERKL